MRKFLFFCYNFVLFLGFFSESIIIKCQQTNKIISDGRNKIRTKGLILDKNKQKIL